MERRTAIFFLLWYALAGLLVFLVDILTNHELVRIDPLSFWQFLSSLGLAVLLWPAVFITQLLVAIFSLGTAFSEKTSYIGIAAIAEVCILVVSMRQFSHWARAKKQVNHKEAIV